MSELFSELSSLWANEKITSVSLSSKCIDILFHLLPNADAYEALGVFFGVDGNR